MWVSPLGGEGSPGGGNGGPLRYPCLENPMDTEAWWATVHGVSKSRIPQKQLKTHTHTTQTHTHTTHHKDTHTDHTHTTHTPHTHTHTHPTLP